MEFSWWAWAPPGLAQGCALLIVTPLRDTLWLSNNPSCSLLFLLLFWYVKITYVLSFIFQSQIMKGINIIFLMMVFHHTFLNIFYHHLMAFWSFLNGFICKFPSHMWWSSNCYHPSCVSPKWRNHSITRINFS